MSSQQPARYSPDRRWWWNGVAWQPAISQDGRWWWDGAAGWKPIPQPKPKRESPLRWFLVGGALLIFVLIGIFGMDGAKGLEHAMDGLTNWANGLGANSR